MTNYLSIFSTPGFNNKLKTIIGEQAYKLIAKKLYEVETKMNSSDYKDNIKEKLELLSNQYIPIKNKDEFFAYFIKYFTLINDLQMVAKIKELKSDYKDKLPEANCADEDKIITPKKKLLKDEEESLNETISVNDFYWLKNLLIKFQNSHKNQWLPLEAHPSKEDFVNLTTSILDHFNIEISSFDGVNKLLQDIWYHGGYKTTNLQILIKKLDEFIPELIDEDGINTTSSVGGYDTPNVFGKTISPKKLKSSGYIPVKYNKKNIKTFDVITNKGKLKENANSYDLVGKAFKNERGWYYKILSYSPEEGFYIVKTNSAMKPGTHKFYLSPTEFHRKNFTLIKENATPNSISDIKVGDKIQYNVSGTTGGSGSRYHSSKGTVRSINKDVTGGAVKVYDDSRDRLIIVDFDDIEQIIIESNDKIKNIIKSIIKEVITEVSYSDILGGTKPAGGSSIINNLVIPNLGKNFDTYVQFRDKEYNLKLGELGGYKAIKNWKSLDAGSHPQSRAQISPDKKIISASIFEPSITHGIIGVLYIKK